MTVSIVPLMKGVLDGRTGGKGAKIVLAQVTIEPDAEVLRPNAKWLDMKSIKAIFPMVGPTFGSSMLLVNLVGPGSVGNYASFTLRRPHLGTIAANTIILGTVATGTVVMPMLIVGE